MTNSCSFCGAGEASPSGLRDFDGSLATPFKCGGHAGKTWYRCGKQCPGCREVHTEKGERGAHGGLVMVCGTVIFPNSYSPP